MTRFAVDPGALSSAAAQVRAAADEADGVTREHEVVAGMAQELGDAGLVRAVLDFSERWRHGLSSLVDDARRVADGLDLAAAAYGDADLAISTAMLGRSP